MVPFWKQQKVINAKTEIPLFAKCNAATKEDFSLVSFISAFRDEPGLKRSLDKVYEIIFDLFPMIVLFSVVTILLN